MTRICRLDFKLLPARVGKRRFEKVKQLELEGAPFTLTRKNLHFSLNSTTWFPSSAWEPNEFDLKLDRGTRLLEPRPQKSHSGSCLGDVASLYSAEVPCVSLLCDGVGFPLLMPCIWERILMQNIVRDVVHRLIDESNLKDGDLFLAYAVIDAMAHACGRAGNPWREAYFEAIAQNGGESGGRAAISSAIRDCGLVTPRRDIKVGSLTPSGLIGFPMVYEVKPQSEWPEELRVDVLVVGFSDFSIEQLRNYILRDLREMYTNRVRWSGKRNATFRTLVLTKDGIAHGYINVSGKEDPTEEDLASYNNTKTVFLAVDSVLYEHPVPLNEEIGIRVGQAGKPITRAVLDQIVEFGRTGKSVN